MALRLNADVGEGFPNDEALAPYLDYANIACGGHAGNSETIAESISLMLSHGVKVGAHPSYSDKINFGRVSMWESLESQALRNIISEQLTVFSEIADKFSINSFHVKPHGAIYNDAYYNREVADAIISAIGVSLYGIDVQVMCQPGSQLEAAAITSGYSVLREGFIDRRYKKDGTLTPRSQEGSVLTDEVEVERQILGFAKYGSIISDEGTLIPVQVDTLCIHSDSPNALESMLLARKFISKKVDVDGSTNLILSGELGVE